jgi:hypothetical protein
VSQRFREISCATLAAIAVAGTAPAVASQPSATSSDWKWREISADFSGSSLVVGLTFTPGPPDLEFTYYRAEASRIALDATRRRFAAQPDTVVNVSSSIASLTGTQIHGGGDGSFVLLPGPGGGAPPVIWCCTDDGDEAVVDSDGRANAARAVAVGFDADRIRLLMRDPAGGAQVFSARVADAEGVKERSPFTGVPSRDTAAVAPGVVAWSDDVAGGVVRIASTTTGAVVPTHDISVGGRVLRVVADTGIVAVTARVGAGVQVIRIDPATGVPAIVWRGSRPPKVAVGGGSVVVADRKIILASLTGRVTRRAVARGAVSAVAVDGDRFAWFERIVRDKQKRTVARLGVVPR